MKYEVVKQDTQAWAAYEETLAPPLYKIIIENDDFTPMEFVVSLLELFFYMDRNQAAEVMLKAHVHGRATCGAYTKEIAESKIAQCEAYARQHDHPLVLQMEGE